MGTTEHKIKQRITEQDALKILDTANNIVGFSGMAPSLVIKSTLFQTLLDKLNEHREPEVKADEGSLMLDAYDGGYINNHGGGDTAWWGDYIRTELGRAHDFYQSQVNLFQVTANKAKVPDYKSKFEFLLQTMHSIAWMRPLDIQPNETLILIEKAALNAIEYTSLPPLKDGAQ